MKIEVFLNLGTNDWPLSPLLAGEHEVSDSLGSELVKAKVAREIVVEVPPPDEESNPPEHPKVKAVKEQFSQTKPGKPTPAQTQE